MSHLGLKTAHGSLLTRAEPTGNMDVDNLIVRNTTVLQGPTTLVAPLTSTSTLAIGSTSVTGTLQVNNEDVALHHAVPTGDHAELAPTVIDLTGTDTLTLVSSYILDVPEAGGAEYHVLVTWSGTWLQAQAGVMRLELRAIVDGGVESPAFSKQVNEISGTGSKEQSGAMTGGAHMVFNAAPTGTIRVYAARVNLRSSDRFYFTHTAYRAH